METKMFCPKCGSAEQTPDSYCRQCGEWLPDLSAASRGRFRTSTREQKVRRMRVLQMISTGLSLASALIIIHVVANGVDQEMLPLAAFCGFLVAVYQIISLILGYNVLSPKKAQSNESDALTTQVSSSQYASLKAADTQEFIKPDSVVENTTALLDHVPAGKYKEDKKR
ncbi:MAG: hypothetical protein WBO10_13790 [Pyrinomonadaceae bacterium]